MAQTSIVFLLLRLGRRSHGCDIEVEEAQVAVVGAEERVADYGGGVGVVGDGFVGEDHEVVVGVVGGRHVNLRKKVADGVAGVGVEGRREQGELWYPWEGPVVLRSQSALWYCGRSRQLK